MPVHLFERHTMNKLLRAGCGALALSGFATLGVQAQTTPPVGRLLASNCFQCHGTNGKGPGFDKLAGKSSGEIYKDLKEFQTGKEGKGIMASHALGYTDSQLRDLSAWLATQR
jgi:sulfide dehydrogenase cytochrome subunit